MIYVCDAIMGTGKSSAAINYLNDHKDDKFIYITPYLNEADRIKTGCPDLDFITPSDKLPEYHFKKTEHTAALIREGKNISTTHSAFKLYDEEILSDIQANGYRLIIDENVDVLEKYAVRYDDVQMVAESGYIDFDNGMYRRTDKEYNGLAFKEMFRFMDHRDLFEVGDENGTHFYYWVLPPDLITSFQDVFILTYLFEGQSIHHFLEMYKLEYKYIGISRRDDGYRFCDYPGDTPEYVNRLDKMLHIIDKPRLNSIGDSRTALSMSWFNTRTEDVEQLKKNISNIMKNIWGDVPADQKMWGGYKGQYDKMKGKGYTKSFLTFNTKATNEYRDKRCLVYITNLFMNPNEKIFYYTHGIEVDEDKYALSIMVQWIWRSAIRDGEEVYLYIPSKRMREILQNWISETMKGAAHDNTEDA